MAVYRQGSKLTTDGLGQTIQWLPLAIRESWIKTSVKKPSERDQGHDRSQTSP